MIGKTLKGLFFTEDDIPEVVNTEVVNTEVEITATAPVEIVATAPVVTPTISAGVNEEMANMLMTAIQDADLEGFDYLEFRNTVNEMGATGMTEANKFLAVFTTAKAMGLTYDKLIDSIGHYQNVIAEQREGFMAQVEQQLASEVEARMTEIDERNSKIAEASEEIAKLNQYIQESQQENLNSQNEANTQKMNIENTRASFESTYNMVAGKLTTDKTNIEMYLGSQATVTPTITEGA